MLRRIRELFNDVFRQADLVLLALCIGTSLFGILMIASATRYMHTSKLVLVQAAALCIGAVLYIVVSQVDLNELAKYWKWIFLVGVVFILLLATPLGIAGDTGNKAWLEFPFLPVKVQPAEIVKLTFIIVLAKQLSWLKENRDLRAISSIVMLAAHFGVIFALYYKISSDMGSALVFLFIFACMCFVAGVALRWFLIGGGAALYFFKFKKPKADTKGNDDLDEYDFGEDEDDEDEPAPEVEDDTGEVEARPLDDYLLDEDGPKKEDEV